MKPRLPIVEKISIYLMLGLIAFVLADLGVMYMRGSLFPTAPPPARPVARQQAMVGGGNLSAITSRNIFNSDGKIPPPWGAAPGESEEAAPDAPPVPSNLPLVLLGTIVHANPARSVATLSLKSKNDQIAVRVGGEIDTLAIVTAIERAKIIFRNSATQRLEYIEMKEESRLQFGGAKPGSAPQQVGAVLKKSDTEFELKRADINKFTSNLPDLLQQARAVPRMGPNGIECFSMADIAPGSLYESLGLKRGDCIKSVNGERIDSPAKAMELYNALRANANNINLGLERGGRDETFNYNISQ